MNPQDHSVQNSPNQTPNPNGSKNKPPLEILVGKGAPNAFKTQLRHRINANEDGKFFNLIDTINPSLERAAALADLLDIGIEAAETQGLVLDRVWLVARTIHLKILDAQTLLETYYPQEKDGAHDRHD